MKTFSIKKILIPVDFSETSLLALDHGIYMASLFKAEITLLHVLKLNVSAYTISDMPMPGDLMKYQEENATEKLNQLAIKIRKENTVKVDILCEIGFVCSTIISMGEKCNADLLIMGTHGISGFTERFIGSNAYRVVNESNCPVITIQTHATKQGFKDIVLPIDHSMYSSQKVNHAIELAKQYGAMIHILGLSHTEDEAELKKLNTKLNRVEKFIDNLGIKNDKQINIGSNYAKLTMSYAEVTFADLIIIMTEWDENITGLFIGPFARQIVNHSKIPVMSIRPQVNQKLIENGILWTEAAQF